MGTFIMEWKSIDSFGFTALPWTHEFDMASERMAVQYAERIIRRITDKAFTGVVLYEVVIEDYTGVRSSRTVCQVDQHVHMDIKTTVVNAQEEIENYWANTI